jgi:hypothetical protein
LQEVEFVRAKIVPKMCQDCARVPLFGITRSTTIIGQGLRLDSFLLAECL